ncbi:regulator of microtubule dynamics protein 1 isoform X1 [Halichoerus grypus]
MALAARLWHFLPWARAVFPGPWLSRGVAGSRGLCCTWRLRGSEVMGNLGSFKRSFLFSALPYLGFETFQVFSQAALVHATAKVVRVEEILEQADYLYESGETEKLYQLLTQYKESEDAELLWRLARASRDIAQLSGTSEEEKKLLVYEALEYAKRALEKNESSFAAHKVVSILAIANDALNMEVQIPLQWYAICISDVGDYEGIKAKIANAYIIKEHFEKAIELNPKDATSIHLMGIWCYTFAEMPWYQRRIAKMLFATPPSSTYEEALGYFHRAEQVDPNFYSKNLLLLGKTYLKLHNKKLAAFWLMKAKDYPAHTEEDKQIQTEAAQLLTGFSDKN